MKMTLIIFLLFIICQLASAPGFRTLFVLDTEPYSKYDKLIRAIVQVESSGNHMAINVKEQAIGAFQIRKCRIDEYNKLTGSSYKLEDCYNYYISRKVFLYFAKGKSFEKAAKSWNGSGPKTEIYWQKIKKRL